MLVNKTVVLRTPRPTPIQERVKLWIDQDQLGDRRSVFSHFFHHGREMISHMQDVVLLTCSRMLGVNPTEEVLNNAL